ncbi:predicted protein [Botrytis cinerea T4]|uniref:Uncharacterized protein n=1 Tax=Botryotinia fuckeliana (strain T4) TaxID=999810 RepID=G2YLU5_BOTF4|nr:predicted protein [Botrytis cinerea T4]
MLSEPNDLEIWIFRKLKQQDIASPVQSTTHPDLIEDTMEALKARFHNHRSVYTSQGGLGNYTSPGIQTLASRMV